MMKPYLLLLLLPCLAWAQINTESMRSTKQTAGLHASIGGDLGLHSGNSNYTNYKAKVRVDLSGGPIESFVVSQYQLAQTDEKKFIDKAFVHLRGMTNTGKRFEVEGFVQYEYNHFIDLKSRRLVGFGSRTKLLDYGAKIKNLTLYLGLGAMMESERTPTMVRKLAPTLNLIYTDTAYWIEYNTKTLIRYTSYLVFHGKLTTSLMGTSTIYYQPAITGFDDYRILWDAMLKVNLTKRLALTNTFNLRYDSLPPNTVAEKHDLELVTGLIYEF